MQRDPQAYLWDIRTAIDAIEGFTRNFDEEAYRSTPLVKSAVERQLEIIGEALNQLLQTDEAIAAQIPERRPAIGLRNVLIHGYATVDDGLIWRTVVNDLPTLRIQVSQMLTRPRQGDDTPKEE